MGQKWSDFESVLIGVLEVNTDNTDEIHKFNKCDLESLLFPFIFSLFVDTIDQLSLIMKYWIAVSACEKSAQTKLK